MIHISSFLLTTLLSWNIVSSVPFKEGSMVNAFATCNDTIYVGGMPGNVIYRVVTDKSGQLSFDGTSEAVCKASAGIKDIIVNGDVLYVCTRDNGYGMGVDYKRPQYLASFEETAGFEASDITGAASADICDSPCPSRWCKSLRLSKGTGKGHVLYSQTVPHSRDSAEFIFWLKFNSADRRTYIPLIEEQLGIAIGRNGRLGLKVGRKCRFGGFKADGNWENLKVVAAGGMVSLDVRGAECQEEWTRICSRKIKALSYDRITLGLECRGASDIQIDEFAYRRNDIEDNSYIDGNLTVLDRHSLKVLNKFNLDLRCLSMVKDGNILYLGMIGGLNIYDIQDPRHPGLIGTFRESVGRLWTYPSGESPYSFKVPGQEFQRMDIMTLPDGRRVIAGGSDTHGVTLVDVSDPTKPTLLKNIMTAPMVPLTNGKQIARYIEWGVKCDYPYIYSSVATLHSIVHNQYFDGKNYPVSPLEPMYGIKVYDISDIGNIKERHVLVPPSYKPTHLAKEGDSCPNQIIRIGDRLYLNFSEKGIAEFSMNGLASSFERMIPVTDSNRVRLLWPYNNGILVGDGYILGPWTSCNIYLLRQ